MKMMLRLILPASLAIILTGCSVIHQMRGLPPQEKDKASATEQKLSANHEQAKKLKSDPDSEFDTGDGKQYDELLARKKKDVFSLKGEEKPIRSIRGSNTVEAEELGKIYDDLDKSRKSGSSVFKFY